MSTVSGVVSNITSANKMSKAGKPFQIYSMEVNGQWFECGFKAPAAVGQTVTFDHTLSYGKNKVTDGTLSIGSTGGARPFPSAVVTSTPSVPGYSGGKSFPMRTDSPDRSIIRQNAVNRAVEILVMLPSEAMVFDYTTEEGKDIIAAHVIGLAQRFEAYYAGETDLAAVSLATKDEVI